MRRFKLLMGLVLASTTAAQGTTTLVSQTPAGLPAGNSTGHPEISTDGRWIAFDSAATDLVVGDANDVQDVFLRDLESGTTEIVSLTSAGTQADGHSALPSVSADGTRVAFLSLALNLASPDANGDADVFVRDRSAGTTVRVSESTAGVQGSGVFRSPTICADGSAVVFVSDAPDLVLGDTNGWFDVFVHDLIAGITERVSFKPSGGQWQVGQLLWWCAPSISGNGRYVVYAAEPQGYGQIYRYDRQTGVTENVSVDPPLGGPSALFPYITPDGGYVMFQGVAGIPGVLTFYVRDLAAGTTSLAATYPDGTPIPFTGVGSGSPERRPVAADGGRIVVFLSDADDLVPGDTNGQQDVFVHDRFTRVTTRVSRGSDGTQANHLSHDPAVSADGRRIVFYTLATNLTVPPASHQTFVHERAPLVPTAYCTPKVNSQGCAPTISGNGTPSASSGLPFLVEAAGAIYQVNGILFYGYGPAYQPFQQAFLCVQPPITRTPAQFSGGNPPPDDCSGTFAFDFNAFIQTAADPFLVSGTAVYAQYWYRDLQYPIGPRTGLTAGLEFVIEP